MKMNKYVKVALGALAAAVAAVAAMQVAEIDMYDGLLNALASFLRMVSGAE